MRRSALPGQRSSPTTREWRNWQTRTVQVRVPARAWGFNSPLAHSRKPQDPNDFKGCCRSEEHTSELQSRGHLVCRLLLEKKKDTRRNSNPPSAFTGTLIRLTTPKRLSKSPRGTWQAHTKHTAKI